MQDFLKKYLNNFSALQMFQLFRFGVLFITGILLLKAGLETSELGEYENLLFFGSLLSFFWIAAFVRAVLSLYKDFEDNDTQLFFNTALSMLICSTMAALMFLGIVNISYEYQALQEYAPAFAAYIILTGPSFLIEYIYLLRNQSRRILGYGIFIFLLQLAAVTLPVFMGYKLEYSIYGLLVVSVVRLIWLVLIIGPFAKWKISAYVFRLVFKLAWPLMLSALMSGSAEYIDGVLVTWYFDEATFAIFRYGAKEFPLFLLVANAFSNTMVPEIAKADSDLTMILDRIKRNSSRMMHIFFPASILLMLVSPILYPLFFKAEFSESAVVFNTYLLLLISRLVFPQTILIGKQKMWGIFNASALEIVLNIILSLVFIRHLGLLGLALATVIASIVEKLYLSYLVWKVYGISVYKYVELKWLLIYTILVCIIFCNLVVFP